MLFKAFAKSYICYITIQLKPETVKLYKHILVRVLLPRFGIFELTEVRKEHVFSMCADLESTPALANRSVAVGSAMYGRARYFGHVPQDFNPFRGGRIYREVPRNRFLSAEEIKRVSLTLDKFDRDQRASPYAIAGIRMLILTGARLTEIEKLQWSEVNFAEHSIQLADSKTGPRTLEMPQRVKHLLENLQSKSGQYVFPGRGGGQIRLNLVWQKVRKIAKVEDVRLHDLRHTYATWAVQNGVPIPTVARLLGHSTEWTTARYLHASRVQSAAAAATISDLIDEKMGIQRY